MRLTIIDNDGFLALVDANRYNSFVNKDWGLEQLISHFIDQSNEARIVMWRTGYEGDKWTVKIEKEKSNKVAFREFESLIEVTNGKLFLTEYADLTMAASYETAKIPSKHNSNLSIKLNNGFYKVLVRQLINPDKEYSDKLEHFEIVFSKTLDENIYSLKNITWFND